MSIVRSPYPDVTIPEVRFPDLVFADVATDGGRPALVDGPSGRTLSLAEVDAASRRFASGVRAVGLAPGEVVALVLPNCVEYAAAFHGTVRAGATAATANPLYTAEELRYQFEHAGARLVVTAPAMAPVVREAAAASGARVFVLGGGGDDDAGPLFDHADDGVEAPPTDLERDAVAILYSSGTSGRPKGVVLTHRNLVAVLSQIRPVFHMGHGDTTIAVLPYFHIFGLQVQLNLPLFTGGRAVTMPRFDLAEFLRLIQEHRATHLFVVPPVALALARHPLVDQYDLSSLRSVLVGAAPLDGEVQQALEKRLGIPAVQGYGMTETSLAIAISPVAGERLAPGAAGVLIPNLEARLDPLGDDGDGRRRRRGARRAVRAGPQHHGRLPGRPRLDGGDDRRRRVAAHRRRGHDLRGRRGDDRRPHQGAHQVQGLPGRAGRARGRAADPPGRGRLARSSAPPTRRPARSPRPTWCSTPA